MRNRIFSLLVFGLVGALTPAARAEYRVFVLKISKAPPAPGQPAEERFIESNLDPWQYVGFYPIHPTETVTYTDTWMCRERTGGRPFCPNPRDPASVPAP
ncbi:MAG: hypothetical protein KF802_04120 [Bdellovibrionaceae bacterium]|nr:hypothetical protein [Pseudobdellovibrionaceae bacterium]MBX3034254.1 hypothetical protein [Pseudobdellovibrionaceae bacterium]